MEMIADYLSHQTQTLFHCEYCGTEQDDSVVLLSHSTSCACRAQTSRELHSKIDKMTLENIKFRADFNLWRETVKIVGAEEFVVTDEWRCPSHPEAGDEKCKHRVCAYKTSTTPLIRSLKQSYQNYLHLKDQVEKAKIPQNYLSMRRKLQDIRLKKIRYSTAANRESRLALAAEISLLEDMSLKGYMDDVKKLIVIPGDAASRFHTVMNQIERNDLRSLEDMDKNGYEAAFAKHQIVTPLRYVNWINEASDEIDVLLDKRSGLVNESTNLMKRAIQSLDDKVLEEAKKRFMEILSLSSRILVCAIPALYFYEKLIDVEEVAHLLFHGTITPYRLRTDASTSYNYVFENVDEIEQMWKDKNKEMVKNGESMDNPKYQSIESHMRDLELFSHDHTMTIVRRFDESEFNGNIVANYLDIAICQHVKQKN